MTFLSTLSEPTRGDPLSSPGQRAWLLRQVAAAAFVVVEVIAFASACSSSGTSSGSPASSTSPSMGTGASASAGVGAPPTAPGSQRAKATLQSKSGSSVSGTVRFETRGDGVHVVADVAGLSPGSHGFHVHEIGDCSSPDGTSAGDHFAGAGVVAGHKLGPTHGLPDAPARHAGDLGNLDAAADGNAHLERGDDVVMLSGERSVIGRAVIVHASRDDGADAKSAGARVACGVIVAE